MLQLIFAIIVFVAIVLFGMANSHDVELRYIVGEPIRIRMIFLLFCVFLAGWATSYFYQLVSQVTRRGRRLHSEYDRDAR